MLFGYELKPKPYNLKMVGEKVINFDQKPLFKIVSAN